MVKSFHRTIIFKHIEEHTLIRHPMNVINMIKPIVNKLLFKCTEVILQRSPMNVSNVGKPLLILVIFMYMNIYILERNHIYAIIVIKPLLT